MAQLGDQQTRHRQPHRVLGAWEGDDDSSGVGPGTRPAEQRGRPNLLEAEHPEQLSEPRQPLVEERVDGFEGAVAPRDAGSAGRDDYVHLAGRGELADERGHFARLVAKNPPPLDNVPGVGEELDDGTPARVGGFGPGVADGDDEAAHRSRCRGAVRDRGHGPIISRCGTICAVSRLIAVSVALLCLAVPAADAPLDRDAERWVTQTLAKLSLDDRIGQLLAPEFDSTYLPTASDEFDRLSKVVRDSPAGAVIAF